MKESSVFFLSAFCVSERFTDKNWLNTTIRKLDEKMQYSVQKAREVDYIPYSTENGQWMENSIHSWTNGFWPAAMWQMYFMTQRQTYRDEAVRTEKMLDRALSSFRELSHDVGFMWLIQSGVHYAVEKNEDSYDRTLFAAYMLASRYNPFGFIRAWNNPGREGWAIIDCMMNLPLLYWASKVTGDVRFKLIAMHHADTTLEHIVRQDGSCNHIVCFDPLTGGFLDNPGGQGYASGSSWSRGQAWGLYGFTLSYLLSGKKDYLNAAKKIAGYFIANIGDDYIPRCDFRQPPHPDVKDTAAGAIAASGLLELCPLIPSCDAKLYYDAAIHMLRTMDTSCMDWENNNPALLTKCTGSYHDIQTRHITMNYADYFFIEAINKLCGLTFSSWAPWPTLNNVHKGKVSREALSGLTPI